MHKHDRFLACLFLKRHLCWATDAQSGKHIKRTQPSTPQGFVSKNFCYVGKIILVQNIKIKRKYLAHYYTCHISEF